MSVLGKEFVEKPLLTRCENLATEQSRRREEKPFSPKKSPKNFFHNLGHSPIDPIEPSLLPLHQQPPIGDRPFHYPIPSKGWDLICGYVTML